MRKFVPGLALIFATPLTYLAILTGNPFDIALASAASSDTTKSDLPTLTDKTRGVSVKVTPTKLGIDANNWEFAIQIDSHSQDIVDDFMKSSLLFDAAGTSYRPTAWSGPPSGGHHIGGILRFESTIPQPQSIELQIRILGDDVPRSFRWQVN
jgi:hypothetical protein